jgi:hypothetical protein
LRVIMSTASLRAGHTEKHLEVLVHGSIMCLDVAIAEWVASDGKPSLADLLDAAFTEVR